MALTQSKRLWDSYMTAAVSQPRTVSGPRRGLGYFSRLLSEIGLTSLNADKYYDIVKPTADQLAEFKREEDDRIAHVATGETIIPMAVFEEDPALKEVLFTRMRDMRIDPERYIVVTNSTALTLSRVSLSSS